MSKLNMQVLESEYSLCRLEVGAAIPQWAFESQFYTITKTSDELSVICESRLVPPQVKKDGEWKLLKIAAVLDLSLTGITARFSTALADADVNLCVIATYDTDYIMVKAEKLSVAIEALDAAGFRVQQPTATL